MFNRALETRFLAGFVITMAMLLLSGVQMLLSLESTLAASRLVVHTYDVLDAISDVNMYMKGMEAGQRSYLITGDEQYVADYDQTARRVSAALDKIQRLTVDNALQQTRTIKLKQISVDRLETMDANIKMFREQGFAAVRESIRTGVARQQMIDVLKLTGEMDDTERVLLTERNAYTQNYARKTMLVGGLLMVLATAGFGVLWWRMRIEMRARAQAEVAAGDKQALLQQILNILPVGVFVADQSGQLIQVNPAAKLLWAGEAKSGLNPYAEYKGRWPHSGVELRPEEWALARTLKTGVTIRDELVDIQCFDGTNKTILNSTLPITNAAGDVVGGISVNQEVTEFKRTERELRDAAHFDATYGLALGLYSSTFDRKRVLKGLLSLLAERHTFAVSVIYLYDEWSGRYRCEAAHALGGEVPQDFALGEGLLGEAAQSGKVAELHTSALTLHTGLIDFAPARVLMLPVQYQEKRLALLVLAASAPPNENERVFLERMTSQLGVALHNLKQYADLKQLATRLRASTDEIAQKNLELQDANRLKNEFLANMSHELRTPLNAIIGFSEVLKDGLVGELTPPQSEYIGEIFSSGRHLLSLINEILDLSKVEAGKMTLDLEHQNVFELVQSSLQIVKEKAFGNALKLRVDVAEEFKKPSTGTILLDTRKAKQILYNLLSNAVKFTPNGGSVQISAQKVGRADVANATFDNYLELSVTDSGIGISEADQGKLFQPFMQIDSALSRRHEGTGLGLVMVRRLAELMGGAVALQSALGQGSTFTVWLPWRALGQSEAAFGLAPERAALPAFTLPAAAVNSGKPLLALMVEDDDASAALMRLHLEGANLCVTHAESAEIALEMAQQEVPDIITLDLLLPGMSGWDFLERIKGIPALSKVPVVIVSFAADKSRGVALGATQVLFKPVSRDELLGALDAIGFTPDASTKRSVLVIDDDPNAVQLFSTYLENFGYTVLAAYGGQEGIALVRSQNPSLIVLDLMMPDVTGFDVVQALKDDAATQAIPILMATAKQITEDDRQRLNGRVVGIIEKAAFSHEYFLREVKRAFAGKRG